MARVYSDETIKRRDVIITVDWGDIQTAVIQGALKELGFDGSFGSGIIESTLTIEQQSEGSPSYPVQKWRGRIKLTLPA